MRALTEVEMPLVHVLQQMEAVGIAVDISIFEKHRVRLWTPDATPFTTATGGLVHSGCSALLEGWTPHLPGGLTRLHL